MGPKREQEPCPGSGAREVAPGTAPGVQWGGGGARRYPAGSAPDPALEDAPLRPGHPRGALSLLTTNPQTVPDIDGSGSDPGSGRFRGDDRQAQAQPPSLQCTGVICIFSRILRFLLILLV